MAFVLLNVCFQVLIFFRILWLTTCTTDCFCYTLNAQMLGWTRSREECRKGGGDLVTMETEEMWGFINSKIQKINVEKNEWHIGLEKKGEEWKWINNKILAYDKWQKGNGEPSGDGDCVAMAKNYPQGTRGLFKDLPCTYPLMYICEYRKGTEPVATLNQLEGNPSCKNGYYPPGCNETKLGSTSAKPTQLVTTASESTQMEATATHTTRTTTGRISTPNDKRNLAVPTTQIHMLENSSEPFPIALVAAITGILLAVFFFLFLTVYFWKTGVHSSRSRSSNHEEISQKNASEVVAVTCIDLNEVRTSSRSTPQRIPVPETDAVIYAEIKDEQVRSNPETITYAEVHDYLSPSTPVPEYLVSCEAMEQHGGPAYQPLHKDTGVVDVALAVEYENAPNSASEKQGGSQIDPSEQLTMANATVDKSMKTKSMHKQVDASYGGPQIDPNEQLTEANAVYATVDKSMKTKSVHKQVDASYGGPQINPNEQLNG